MSRVGLLLVFERRAAQLPKLAGRMGPRGDGQRFIEGGREARGVFFQDSPDLGNQLRRWRGLRFDRVRTLHREIISGRQSAELLSMQGLDEITRAAAVRERRQLRSSDPSPSCDCI